VRPTICVCIATYRRPEGLKRLLLSILAQETNEEFVHTISVADNDFHRSAEAVIRELNASGHQIIYDVEPEQNISLARNKAILQCTSDYIATTDDDLYVDSRWLIHLYRTITNHEADVVHGPVVPRFHSKTPNYIKECGAFERPNPPTGSSGNYIYTTANALFRRRVIQENSPPFDVQFGKSGGEDTVFFENLKKQGYKQVWCQEALVYNPVPVERTSWRWILLREFRIGNLHYRVYGRGPVDSKPTRKAKIRFLIKKIVRQCYPVPFYICRGFVDARYAVKAIGRLRSSAFFTGMIAYFLGYDYEEYRRR
jgi:succinoglycan biosynthesis protein ExoM